ncbi:DUF2764 family protein [Spirochaeta isovalerica]|uniref:DUF2764 family protein n=1 Tax=Spirochaeta isovalerica TaxID=150 RepID=A0A841R576_9SPIO|nr:DUF2764 family protein [Spirochaeta isovalerica]MBB6478976.1 hypothetical protein [Spirochaeta isovalerica]
MSQYYYTMASLPMLSYDGSLHIDSELFLDYCSRELNEESMEKLMNCKISIPENEALLEGAARDFWAWEKSLKNELVKLRARNMNVDEKDYIREGETLFGTPEIAASAMKIDSPLEAENFLNRARWSALDQLGTGHYFDFEALAVYYLQLQLLERKSLFDAERGYEKYQEIYQNILSNVDEDITVGDSK